MLPESFFDFLFNIVVYLAFALPLYFYCTPYVDAISTADLLEYDEASTDVDQQGEDTLHSPVASSPIKISADDVASSFQKTHQRARSHTDSEGFFEEVSANFNHHFDLFNRQKCGVFCLHPIMDLNH